MQRRKYCTKCNKNRLIKFFGVDKSCKDGLRSCCKKCNYKDKNNRRKLRRHYIYNILATSGGCVDCGESNVATLQFDHIRGTKTINISNIANFKSSIKAIDEEIAKCDIVCANCHAIRTAKSQNWYMHIEK